MSSAILIQIGQIMFPLIAIVSVGVLIGIRQYPQLDSINDINLNVFIPALVFSSLLHQSFHIKEYAILGLCGLALVLITALIVLPLAQLLRTEYKTIAPTMMFHNAGNVGLPLLSLAFGTKGLAAGLILFLVGNITHFGLGSYMLDRDAKWIRSLTSPAILAAVLALTLQAKQVIIVDFILLPIQMLGSIAVPLMLFSLGVQLSQAKFDHWKLGIFIGLLTPLVGVTIALIVLTLVPLDKTQTGALIFVRCFTARCNEFFYLPNVMLKNL